MAKQRVLHTLQRHPHYPVMIEISGNVFAARTPESLLAKLSEYEIPADSIYEAADITGARWELRAYDDDELVLMPSFRGGKFTKKELIQWYNGRKNKGKNQQPYSEKSLSSKRFDRIIGDLVELLLAETDEATPTAAAQDPQQAKSKKHRAKTKRRSASSSKLDEEAIDMLIEKGRGAASARDALEYFEQAVAAAERALGKRALAQRDGYLADNPRSWVYFQALYELGSCLWQLQRSEEAIRTYWKLLEADIDDQHAARVLLMSWLLTEEQDKAAWQLWTIFQDEPMADWKYARALLEYRRSGDTPEARQWLQEAAKANPHVPQYIAGHQQLPTNPSPFVGFGDESEAESYTFLHLKNWKATPGAIPWMRDVLKISHAETRPPRQAKWPRLAADVLELPQDEDDVWHVDVQRFPTDEPSDATPWLFLVTSPVHEQIIAFQPQPNKPSREEALMLLAETMLDPPNDIEPRRPQAVYVRLRALQSAWKERLAEVDIDCLYTDDMEYIDQLIENIYDSPTMMRPASQIEQVADVELLELPQYGEETWQADTTQMATWIGETGTPQRPWMAIVTNRSEDAIIAQDLVTEEPAANWLISVVRAAMSAPMIGEPHRPGNIVVRSPAQQAILEPMLDSLNIICDCQTELDQIDFIFEDMIRHMTGRDSPAALLDAPGVEPHHLEPFFDAAADFYRQKPWRKAPSDVPIRIECDHFSTSTWYAIVMGQSGMIEGVALYEDLASLRKTLTGKYSDQDNARHTSALSVQFNEAFEILPVDLHHLERFGWQVAGPEAYPSIMRVNPGMAVRPPLVWEIQLAVASLRAIPEFLRRQADVTFDQTQVIRHGDLELHMKWEDLGLD